MELRNPGLPCGRLQAPGQALPWAGTAKGCPGPAGRVSAAPAPPACHTRTLPSAQPSGQLCPPEIITSFHLLPPVAFTISISALRGSQRHLPLPSPALHPGSPQASFTLTEPPAPSLMNVFSCCYSSFPLDLGCLGEWEVSWGSLDPGFGSWCSWKEGAALLPAIISPASEPRVLLCPILCSCPPMYNLQCPSPAACPLCPLPSAGIVLGPRMSPLGGLLADPPLPQGPGQWLWSSSALTPSSPGLGPNPGLIMAFKHPHVPLAPGLALLPCPSAPGPGGEGSAPAVLLQPCPSCPGCTKQ